MCSRLVPILIALFAIVAFVVEVSLGDDSATAEHSTDDDYATGEDYDDDRVDNDLLDELPAVGDADKWEDEDEYAYRRQASVWR